MLVDNRRLFLFEKVFLKIFCSLIILSGKSAAYFLSIALPPLAAQNRTKKT